MFGDLLLPSPPPVSTPSQPSVAIPSVTHPLVGNGTLLPVHPVENALRSVSTSLYHLCHTPPPPLFSVCGYVSSYNDSVTPTSQTRSLAFSSFLFRLIFFVPPLFRVCGNEDRRKGWLWSSFLRSFFRLSSRSLPVDMFLHFQGVNREEQEWRIFFYRLLHILYCVCIISFCVIHLLHFVCEGLCQLNGNNCGANL